MKRLPKMGVLRRLIEGPRRKYRSLQLKRAEKRGAASVKSSYGLVFSSNFSDLTFQFYVKAIYGYFYWNRLKSIDRRFVFLDIGANQGLYAIGAAKNPNLVKAYAFEPVRHIAALLRKNIELNDAATKCIVVQKAVSDRSGEKEIHVHDAHSGVSTLAANNPKAEGLPGSEIIETIDAFGLEDVVQPGDEPIFVKVDVEGHERVVLEQLLKAEFSSRIEEIFYEVDENWVDARAIADMLENSGFRLTKIGRRSHYDVLAERI